MLWTDRKGVLIVLLAANLCLNAQVPRPVVPTGHTTQISSVAFSPGGKLILTASIDGSTKLWNLYGKEIQTFPEPTKIVSSIAFSPDGKFVLTASNSYPDNMWCSCSPQPNSRGDQYNVKLWDLNGKEVQVFNGNPDWITSVAFSPDGKHIVTGGWGGIVNLWNLDGTISQSILGDSFAIFSVAFAPNSKYILTGGWDGTAKLWNLNGTMIQSLQGHSKSIVSVAFSPNNKYILTGSPDSTAKLWNLSGELIHSFHGHNGGVSSVAFSPDGKYILTGSGDQTARLWSLNGELIHSFIGHTDEVSSVAFSPDGKYILTGSKDQSVKIWNLMDENILSIEGHSKTVHCAVFTPDMKYILMGGGGRDNFAKLWDLTKNKIQNLKGHTNSISIVDFSNDGKYALTGSIDSTAKLWTLDGRELQTFKGHRGAITSVAFSPDGNYILTGSRDTTAQIWSLTGMEIQSFKGHAAGINSVNFSPDGQLILTGSDDRTAKLWNKSGNLIQNFKGHSLGVYYAVFSPDGENILTCSDDHTAKLWAVTGKEIQNLKGHMHGIRTASFSPDGKYVLTGSIDNSAKLWNLQGKEILTLKGHQSDVSSAKFSPDGRFVLTGSSDNTAKIWDPVSGENLATLVTIDSTDWAVTTPSGLFDASPGAMKLMHYVVGLDVIDLDQLKERYYEPGLLAKIIGFDKSKLRDVKAFTEVALYPEINATIDKDQLAIELTERNGGIGKLSLSINGKEVQEDLNSARQKNLTVSLSTFAKYYRTYTTNTIALRAYNAEGWLKSQAYELTYIPAKAKGNELPDATKPISKARPSLYTLAIGTSKYAGDHHLDLKYADQDAQAMGKALRDAGSALFTSDSTHVQVLTSTGNTPAEICTKAIIRQAFHDIAAKAKPEDVVIVFLSGHGLAYGPAEKEQFYYLTKDIGSEKLDDKDIREAYTISSEELTRWLTDIPAQKQVMIIDACNAGKAVESLAAVVSKDLNPSQIRALDRMKDRTGMFILTGSAGDKVSYEASQYGQGLLTYSLLQGMGGLALTEDKRVDVMTLFQYSRDKVPELAKGIGGIQTPVLAFPSGGASFDIGIVTPQVKIPVAQVKPVFIRNNFTNEVSFTDDLKLTKALENYFREITALGAEADLIFVDVSEYENAYSIKGLYSVTGEAVQVRGRLFKGETSQGEFQVTGVKSDIPGLVKKIVEQVQGMIK